MAKGNFACIDFSTLPPSLTSPSTPSLLYTVNQPTPSYILISLVLFTCYSFAQTQTFITLLTIKSKLISAALLISQFSLALTLSSNTLRAIRSLPDWQYYLTYVLQPRYASALIHTEIFQDGLLSGYRNEVGSECTKISFEHGCRFVNGTHYLMDKFYKDDLGVGLNLGMCFVFWAGGILACVLAYACALPEVVKRKFRD